MRNVRARVFFVWAIGLLALVNVSLGGPGYESISTSHHIMGEIAGEIGYDESGTSPLSNSFSNSLGEVSSATDISSWFEFDEFRCFAGAQKYSDIDASATAEISMIFKPYGNSFEIHTLLDEARSGAYSLVRITDLMTGIPVFLNNYPGGLPDGVYAINPDHIYELYVYTMASVQEGGNDEYSFAAAEVNFSVIPEPTTLLLLGLGGVMLRRRSRGPVESA